MLLSVLHRRMAMVLGSVLLLGSAASFAADKPAELTISDKLRLAQSNMADAEERENAIRSLGNISKEQESDNKVVEALLEVVAKADDIFARIAAIETLGRIQQNVTKDDRAKTKYMDAFIAILKNANEHVLVRISVARVFKDTLDKSKLSDLNKAFPAIVDIVKNKQEPTTLRVACIEAIGAFGAGTHIETLSGLLNEQDVQVREASAKAMSDLLLKAPDQKLGIATINKLLELVKDNKAPMDLRVAVMKLLAQLLREEDPTVRNTEAFSVILKICETAEQDDLIVGAVEALGIVGSAEAVAPLKKTYKQVYNEKQPDAQKDVRIRKAIMKSLRAVLQVQNAKKTPDTRAVHEAIGVLVDAVDNDGSATVKDSAVYSLKYSYPKKFEAEHKEVSEALIWLMKETKSEDLKAKILSSLQAITQKDFGTDNERWQKWFDEKYPGAARPKKVAGEK